MRFEEVDERDSRWESHSACYRVYVFRPGGGSWTTETYDVTDAQVPEVIAWAADRAGDGLYAVALVSQREADGSSGRGLIWLVGMDANDDPRDELEQRLLSEMHDRRAMRARR